MEFWTFHKEERLTLSPSSKFCSCVKDPDSLIKDKIKLILAVVRVICNGGAPYQAIPPPLNLNC